MPFVPIFHLMKCHGHNIPDRLISIKEIAHPLVKRLYTDRKIAPKTSTSDKSTPCKSIMAVVPTLVIEPVNA